jgi:hypothetical protein
LAWFQAVLGATFIFVFGTTLALAFLAAIAWFVEWLLS